MPIEWGWFDTDDELLNGLQTAFIETVRSHAATWTWCEPSDTCALIDEEEPRELRLILDVVAWRGSIVATLGVFLNGDVMQCGETHTQNYALESTQRIPGLDTSGSPQELGAMAANWLERTVPLLR